MPKDKDPPSEVDVADDIALTQQESGLKWSGVSLITTEVLEKWGQTLWQRARMKSGERPTYKELKAQGLWYANGDTSSRGYSGDHTTIDLHSKDEEDDDGDEFYDSTNCGYD